MLLPILIFGVILKGGIYDTRAIKFGMSGVRTRSSSSAQSPEETCLSLAHQNPSKTSEKWVILIALIALQFRYTFYRPQTKRLRARKIGLQYKIRKACPFFYSALRASVALRATCRAPARIWLAVIDFQKSIWVR